MNTNSKLQKQITGEIADASGHTDFIGSIDEAVATIMENVKKFGKWAYINGQPFIFENYGDEEAAALYEKLDSVDEPHFTLTPAITGGATEDTVSCFLLVMDRPMWVKTLHGLA